MTKQICHVSAVKILKKCVQNKSQSTLIINFQLSLVNIFWHPVICAQQKKLNLMGEGNNLKKIILVTSEVITYDQNILN